MSQIKAQQPLYPGHALVCKFLPTVIEPGLARDRVPAGSVNGVLALQMRKAVLRHSRQDADAINVVTVGFSPSIRSVGSRGPESQQFVGKKL
jgi:hypothetical protein